MAVLILPAAQSVHMLLPTDELNVPDAQAEHELIPGEDAKVPNPHETHTPSFQAPEDAPAFPTGQSTHVTSPKTVHWP